MSQDLSDNSGSNDISDNDSDDFLFEGNFLPYQDEPIASSSGSDDTEDDETNEDGIPRAVLEQRYEKILSRESW